MKRHFKEPIGVLFALIILVIGTTGAEAQYCASASQYFTYEWTAGVEFAGIDNPSEGSSYSDFTDQQGVVAPGVSYQFIGSMGQDTYGWNAFYTVFIDFNQDEDFNDPGERFDIGSANCAGGCDVIGDILIPADATPGTTRMRVVLQESSYIPGPCEASYYFGETEDYSLLVSGDCTPPDFAYNITDDCDAFTYNVTAMLNDFGGDLDGPNQSITIYLNRSDIGDAGFVTYGDEQVGQTADVITDVPFGVTVTASIEGNDSDCNMSRTWNADGLCPPVNNDCETAILLDCWETIEGSTINGSGAPPGIDFCNGFASPASAVWYTYTATSYSSLTVSITPDNFDAQHFVYAGGCGDLQCINGSDEEPISWSAAAGQTFYIMVTGWGTSVGDFTLNLECIDFPACDYPTLNTTMVDENGDEITDCLPVGDTYRVEVSLTDGYEDSYLVFVGDSSKVMFPPETHVFGTFDAGSNTNVIVSSFETPEFCNLYGLIESELCPPTNDLCEYAFEANCGQQYTGTTLGATAEVGQPYCGTTAPAATNGGVWYTFTHYGIDDIYIDLSGSDYDTKLFLYSGECGALTCIAGDDDGGEGSDSKIYGAFPAGDYYIYISGFGANRGSFLMDISCYGIPCGPEVTAVATDAEGTAIEDCVDETGEYYVLVDIEGGANNDFYNVSVNGGDPILVEDNGSGFLGPVAASVNANISVTGVVQNSCVGYASVSVDICPPTNDTPCEAIAIPSDGSYSTYSNVNATADAGEVAPPAAGCNEPLSWCNSTISNSVWFTFVGPESGRATVSLCGSESVGFDTQIAVYAVEDCADYGTYTLVAANDDAGTSVCSFSGLRSVTTGCFTPGETYYVQVDSYSAITQGSFEISVIEEDGAICDCVLPDLDSAFIFADTQPICDDPENPVFSLTFFAPEDLGSQDGMVYTYDWDDNPGEPITITITDTYVAPELFPLGTFVNITVTITEEACEDVDGSIYPLSGNVVQDENACIPGCDFIGTPCDLEGVPGSYNQECECIPVPENDTCADAIPLSCDDYVAGTNAGATVNVGCDGNSRRTVWYSYTAAANGSVFMTTCNPETNFDTDINMYTGNCDGDLVCFSGWGDGGYIDGSSGCEFQSWAAEGTFDVEAGITYYIAVTGFYADGDSDSSEGDFGLSLTCALDEVSILDGTVDWNASCGDRALTVDFYEPGTDVLIESYLGMVSADGTFSIPEVAVGTFDVIAKVEGSLAKGFSDFVISSDANTLDIGAIIKGDINGDNKINIIDVSIITAAFNSSEGDVNFNPLADLNCSGGVNIADISIITPSFFANGDEAPLE